MRRAASPDAAVCVKKAAMDRQQILSRLRDHEASLKARGVAHAALFGSRARGDAGPESDIDILVDIAPETRMDVFGYVGIVQAIADLFDSPVDVANRQALKAHVRPEAERDAIYAF